MHENRTSVSTTDNQPDLPNAALVKKAFERQNPPYDVHVHTVRKRLGDVDGISAKAAIDGLVKAGIFPDDKAEYIQSIKFTQEKGADEKTIITIT